MPKHFSVSTTLKQASLKSSRESGFWIGYELWEPDLIQVPTRAHQKAQYLTPDLSIEQVHRNE